MKTVMKLSLITSVIVFSFSCATLNGYRQADEYKHQIWSLALLPLIVGDDDGRIEKLGSSELQEFLDYFDGRFYNDFESEVRIINSIDLKLPGRDFNINVYNGMDYFAAARKLDVDAVLGVNLTLYNEVKPGAKGAQVAAAVFTTLVFGGYVTERQVVGYDTHYAYLEIEKVDESLTFKYSGKVFPPIEEQRKLFVDKLISHIDRNFPLSTDYIPAYKD